MTKSVLLGLFAVLMAISPCAAQSWGVYNPNAKFAQVFGRPAVLERNGAINADPSLDEVARSNNEFLKTALNNMLETSARVSACQELSSLKLPWVQPRAPPQETLRRTPRRRRPACVSVTCRYSTAFYDGLG